MKKIELKKLKIENFKKIKSLEIDFKEKTTITGKNGVGKTTVFDAFSWLLFGKDSQGKTDFEIKLLDANNNPTHKLEHSVFGEINNFTLKRVYREVYTKKRGEETATFDGHETIYEIDGAVVKKKDYEEFIKKLIDESLFKLITSTTYFHSLKWEDRRTILYSLVQNMSDIDIAGKNEDFVKLVNFLNGKSIEDYTKELKSKIKTAKDELKGIPEAISELALNIPEEIELSELLKEKENLGNPNEINAPILAEIKRIDEEILKVKQLHEKKIYDSKLSKNNAENELFQMNNNLIKLKDQRDAYVVELNSLREKYTLEFAKEFSTLACNTCGTNTFEIMQVLQKYAGDEDADKLYESLAEKDVNSIEIFNKAKAKALEDINEIGGRKKILKEDLDRQIVELETKIKTFVIPPIDESVLDVSELEKSKPELKTVDESCIARISEIDGIIGKQGLIDDMNKRLTALKEKEQVISKQLASLEKTQMVCEKFVREKSDIFVEKINGLFKFVQFKLYETQINGSEIPCCETLVNGIPYSTNLNTGAKVNAGIEICNVISTLNDTFCPIFTDNMESCTSPIEVVSQSVFLVADKSIDTLTII